MLAAHILWAFQIIGFRHFDLPLWIGALTPDQGLTLLSHYGESSLSYWKTAPAAGQRLEPSFHRMRYGGITTSGRWLPSVTVGFRSNPYSFPGNRMLDSDHTRTISDRSPCHRWGTYVQSFDVAGSRSKRSNYAYCSRLIPYSAKLTREEWQSRVNAARERLKQRREELRLEREKQVGPKREELRLNHEKRVGPKQEGPFRKIARPGLDQSRKS